MQTKLTLRLDERLVQSAKREAHRRGKSVSRMVAEYFRAFDGEQRSLQGVPPVTSSLRGVLRASNVGEEDYRRHLKEKHL